MAVPGVEDEVGHFLPSGAGVLESNYTLDDLEKELDAQIQRALVSGVKLKSMDNHIQLLLRSF